MAGLLGDVFSAADTAKRKLRGLLADPVGTLQQYVGNENDRAGRFNQLTDNAATEMQNRIKNGGKLGPNQVKLAGLLADAYNPIGMTSIGSKGFVPLSEEIASARSRAIPREIDFGDGRTVRVSPARNSYGDPSLNADVHFANAATRARSTYPAGSNFQNSQVSGYLNSVDEIDKVRGVRREVANAKNDLHGYIQAQQELTRSANAPIAQPSWVDELMPQQNATYADADWWKKATKDGEWKAFQAFADQASGSSLMKFGDASSSQSADEIAKHFGLSARQTGDGILFTGDNGALQVFNASGEPFIRSIAANSSGKASGGGNKLYQAAMNWAANNGKTFAPDPAGITPINELRKVGNELSSQIRNGIPTAQMNSPGVSGLAGIGELWQAEAAMAKKRVPAVKGLTFDGQSFNKADDEIVSMIADSDPKFSKGVGLMTAKRSAIADWIKSSKASDAAAKAAAAGLIAAGSGPLFANED